MTDAPNPIQEAVAWLRSGFGPNLPTYDPVRAANYTRWADAIEAQGREIERLRNAGWQPIETAPRDGTLIILTTGSTSGTGRWTAIASRDTLQDVDGVATFAREYGWRSASDKALTRSKPTYWMPLPELPSSNPSEDTGSTDRDAIMVDAARVGQASVMPWHRPELKRWTIVGMNHYHVSGQRRLYVSMTWRGPGKYCITAEGLDGPELWDELARQSVEAIGKQQ